jgi:hypothetical protein
MTAAFMLAVALKYMSLGVPVFPIWPVLADGTCACRDRFGHCAGAGKHPATRWRHGSPDALPSTDPARAQAWWGLGAARFGIPRAAYGIAMPTGQISGIFVVDLDNKPTANGIDNLARLADEYGALPDGPLVVTPSGGRHMYFQAPDGGGPTTACVLAPGCDTRGEGGMVVLAPSMHKSGRRYRWEKRLSLYLPDGLPTVPTWVLERLKPKLMRRKTALPQQRGGRAWVVSRDEAAATLVAVLDSSYSRWMVDAPEDVKREAWRAFATNLHAACAGHRDLLDLARAAWHQVSACDVGRYLYGDAERVWNDAAKSLPISFEHAEQNYAPEGICSSGDRNLVLEARRLARSSPTSLAFTEAALNFLAAAPGGLKAAAEERGVTTRDVLLDEGYLEDTSGYVRGTRRVDTDEEEDPASPA